MLSGGTPSKQRAANWVGTVPWASPKDMKRLYLPDTEDHISEEAAEELTIVPKGTVLVVVRGMILAKTVPVCRIEVPMTFNQDMKALVVRDAKRIDQEFLLYALDHARDEIPVDRAAHGTCKLNTEMLAQVRIAAPPLAMQREIVGVLEAVRRSQQASQLTLTASKKLLERYVDAATAIEEGGSANDENYGSRGVTTGTIGQFLRSSQYGLSVRAAETGRVPMLRMNAIQEGRLRSDDLTYVDLDDETLVKYRLHPGDILFNRTNSQERVGKVAVFELTGDYVFASYLVRLIADDERVDPRYLGTLLNSSLIQQKIRQLASPAVSQSNINPTNLKSVQITVPSLDEQRRIVAIRSAIDAKIDAERRRLAALEDLYRTLLHGLMTGALRVDDPSVARETAQLSLPANPVE